MAHRNAGTREIDAVIGFPAGEITVPRESGEKDWSCANFIVQTAIESNRAGNREKIEGVRGIIVIRET